jgi:hypothetical protein
LIAVPAFLGDLILENLEVWPNDLNMLLQLACSGNGTGRGNAWHDRAILGKGERGGFVTGRSILGDFYH